MDQDLDALRRRAFSRDGSPEDLRRLALALEAAPTAAADSSAPTPTVDPSPPDDAVGTAGEHRRPARRRRRPVLPVALGMLAGVVLGAGAMQLVAAPSADSADALRVFDRPAADFPADVVLPTGFLGGPDAEVRYLGEVDGGHVFASRTVGSQQTVVCLGLVTPASAGGSCASADDFRRSGVVLSAGDIAIGWGPRGEELWTPPPIDAGEHGSAGSVDAASLDGI